jgi:hypothetical protein
MLLFVNYEEHIVNFHQIDVTLMDEGGHTKKKPGSWAGSVNGRILGRRWLPKTASAQPASTRRAGK